MYQEQQFIEALLLAPDDWVTRSVLADWCEENGQQERADVIRQRLFRPFRFTALCPAIRCEGGLIELNETSDLDRPGQIEVTRRINGRGYVHYERCRECSGTGKIGGWHSREWLIGLPCADSWLADHPDELGSLLGIKDSDRDPTMPYDMIRNLYRAHHDDEPLEMSVGGIHWSGRMREVVP